MSVAHDSSVAEISDAVFHAHNVSNMYTMGEMEVQALRSAMLDLYDGELVVLLETAQGPPPGASR